MISPGGLPWWELRTEFFPFEWCCVPVLNFFSWVLSAMRLCPDHRGTKPLRGLFLLAPAFVLVADRGIILHWFLDETGSSISILDGRRKGSVTKHHHRPLLLLSPFKIPHYAR